MNVVDIGKLFYTYGDGNVALKDMNLSVERGEQVAIMGPNGAGKSTLLKIIGGLLFPFKGELKIFGEKVTKKNADRLRRKVGILFQDPDDQIFMPKVWDDIAFGPINMGLGGSEIKRRVKVAMKQTGLTGFEDRTAHHLSFGEKKRVAIAGILAMRPALLLLDEPTANLDPKGREEMINIIKRLRTTVIFSTHDVDTAIIMAEKALILNKERLAYGTIREIFSNERLLKKAHLDVPEITKLFLELNRSGYKFKKLPLTKEEAIQCVHDMKLKKSDGNAR